MSIFSLFLEYLDEQFFLTNKYLFELSSGRRILNFFLSLYSALTLPHTGSETSIFNVLEIPSTLSCCLHNLRRVISTHRHSEEIEILQLSEQMISHVSSRMAVLADSGVSLIEQLLELAESQRHRPHRVVRLTGVPRERYTSLGQFRCKFGSRLRQIQTIVRYHR